MHVAEVGSGDFRNCHEGCSERAVVSIVIAAACRDTAGTAPFPHGSGQEKELRVVTKRIFSVFQSSSQSNS